MNKKISKEKRLRFKAYAIDDNTAYLNKLNMIEHSDDKNEDNSST